MIQENGKKNSKIMKNITNTEILKMQCALDNAIMEDSFGILYQKEFQELAKCFETE